LSETLKELFLNRFAFLLLLLSIGSVISYYPSSKIATLENNIQAFLSDNGLKYVTLVENSTVCSKAKQKLWQVLVKCGSSFVTTITMDDYLKTYSFRFLDVAIFIFDLQKDDIGQLLLAVTRTPVKSSILLSKSFLND
jgi:hypothetical protein